MGEIRLQKYISDCGIMSRRAAEAEIAAKKVKVNGKTAEIGQKIDPEKDKVEIGGKPLRMQRKSTYTYVMLNKPRGYLSSVSDDRGRKCVTELVSDIKLRLYPVGRLDMDSDGLLLMTNDGDLTNRLTHPRHEIPKIYRVKVKPAPNKEQLALLGSSLVIDGYKIQPAEVEILTSDEEKESAIILIKLYEGRNRQIRKMCEAAKLSVLWLTRIAIGELDLGKLGRGKWRYLTDEEVAYLKNEKSHIIGE